MSNFIVRLGSPDALEILSETERNHLSLTLSNCLGDRFEPLCSPDKTVRIKDKLSGLEFSLIPGGSMEMGLSENDLAVLGSRVDIELVEYSVAVDGVSATPAHMVNVKPFLCSNKSLAEGSMSRSEAISKITTLGFRLPSEIEFEWILRDGGRFAFVLDATPVEGKPGNFEFQTSRYGIENLLIANWVADDWHPNYQHAPIESFAWMNGDSRGVSRCTFPLWSLVSQEDLSVLLAAIRLPGDEKFPCVVRAALSIPESFYLE